MVGIVIAAVLIAFIVWIYVRQPQNPGEVFPRQVDREAFERGRNLFHQDEFVAARLEFEGADPGRADAKTQFYTAYSYYREGCGFFRQNDELLEPVERAIARATSGVFLSMTATSTSRPRRR